MSYTGQEVPIAADRPSTIDNIIYFSDRASEGISTALQNAFPSSNKVCGYLFPPMPTSPVYHVLMRFLTDIVLAGPYLLARTSGLIYSLSHRPSCHVILQWSDSLQWGCWYCITVFLAIAPCPQFSDPRSVDPCFANDEVR